MAEIKLTRVPVSNVVPVVRNPVVNTQYEQDSDYDDEDDYDIDIQTISSSKIVIKRTLIIIMVILFLYIFAAYAYYNYHEDMMVSVLIIFFFIYLVYFFIISKDYIQSKFHILFYYLVNGVMLGYIGVICHLGIELAWAWQQYNRISNGEKNSDMKSHDFYHIHRRINIDKNGDEKDVLGVLIAHVVFMVVTMVLFTISFKIAVYGKFVLKDYNIAPEKSMDIYEEKESYSILMKEIEKFILLFIILDIGFPILNFTYNLMMEDLVAAFSIVFAVFHLIYFFNVTPQSMKKNEAVGYFLSFLLMCGVGLGYLGLFIYFLVRTIQYIIINQGNADSEEDRQFYVDRYFPLPNENTDQGGGDFKIDYNISLFSYISYGCVMLVYLFAAGYSVLMVKDGWRLFVNRDSVNVELLPKNNNNQNQNNNHREENSFNHSSKNIKIEMGITMIFDLFYFIYCFAYNQYDETDLGIIYVVMFVIDVIFLIIIFTKYTEEPVYLLFYYLSVICSCGRLITMFYTMKRMRDATDYYVFFHIGEYKTLAILTGIIIVVFIIIAFVNWRSIISGLCLWKMTKNHPHGELLGIFSYLLSLIHTKKEKKKEEESSSNNNINAVLEMKPVEVELPNVVPVHPEMNDNDNNNQPINQNSNNNNNNNNSNYVKIDGNKIETKVEPAAQPVVAHKSDESKDDSVVVIDNEEDIPDQLDLPPELQ